MAYGITIPNTSSLTTTPDDFRSARLLRILQVRSWSGTAYIPEFNSGNGFMFCRINSFSYSTPKLTFDNVSKVLTWQVGGIGNVNDITWSRNFDVFFFESGAV